MVYGARPGHRALRQSAQRGLSRSGHKMHRSAAYSGVMVARPLVQGTGTLYALHPLVAGYLGTSSANRHRVGSAMEGQILGSLPLFFFIVLSGPGWSPPG